MCIARNYLTESWECLRRKSVKLKHFNRCINDSCIKAVILHFLLRCICIMRLNIFGKNLISFRSNCVARAPITAISGGRYFADYCLIQLNIIEINVDTCVMIVSHSYPIKMGNRKIASKKKTHGALFESKSSHKQWYTLHLNTESRYKCISHVFDARNR